MMHPRAPSLPRLLDLLHRIEDAILIGVLGAMIVFGALQIVLRNLFDAGIIWADPLLRVLVLWVGLVGAMVASRSDNHIAINVLSRFLATRWKAVAGTLVALFTSGVCAVIAYHSYRFVVAETSSGVKAVGTVPVWVAESIIPIAFTIIALRYLVFAVMRAREIRIRPKA